ncbi:hypothetical protein SAMN05421788_103338 [Filimonas lacunae]|uniref:Uncharacterized protein n=1 Tax=Filimonas lacunae TaxID=477680 RepID=A0A173MK23_9BACT|nr:hypothetical protein [Filimonas lacunae]BAV07995.1 hypothetical protein FLA_4028 [Filimonas lacunae]SIT07661.1 hypothetical protein SAMN05421788_103338 [Filimonas lacunae]
MQHTWLLAQEEKELVQNAQWLLTKQRVIEKVYELFGQLSTAYTPLLQQCTAADAAVKAVSPKIARGEFYRQLPYVVLDQPRYFKQDDAFAIRSFFWWGHSFSIHLHLAGHYKTLLQNVLSQKLAAGHLQQWQVATGSDPWQHHFAPDTYIPVTRNNHPAVLQTWQQQPFIKLARELPLQQWEHAYTFYVESFTALMALLA